MAYRPYFKNRIEELQTLVDSSSNELKVLKVVQYELKFRDRPKAKALKVKVDELVHQLSANSNALYTQQESPAQQLKKNLSERPTVDQTPATPDRIVVQCANCKTPNFVSTLDGIAQHLSCSACKTPYEAQFKYGVMRTTFQAKPTSVLSDSALKWFLLSLVLLVIIVLVAK